MHLSPERAAEFAEHLQRMGVERCPICGGPLILDPRPAVVSQGGVDWGDARDRETDITFAAVVRCEMCGHLLLFDIEKLHDGDAPIYDPGPEFD